MRPPTAAVRSSRRAIYDALKGEAPIDEMAKILMSYEAPKAAMEAAKIHSATALAGLGVVQHGALQLRGLP